MQNFLQNNIAISVTLMNLVCGSLALLYTINSSYAVAAVLILLGVILDGMDGRIARRMDRSSDLGKELDSLCDLVSFGVAPALLIYTQCLSVLLPTIGLLVVLFYILCGAYRLARFNVLNIHEYFTGIPITSAGAAVATLSLLNAYIPGYIVFMIVLILAVLMVSRIRVPKLQLNVFH